MNFYGVVMGVAVFILIGAGHIMVINGAHSQHSAGRPGNPIYLLPIKGALGLRKE